MRRREFIAILAGAAAWPVPAHVQQLEHVAKLGILMQYAEDDREVQHRLTIFRNQLRDLGWVEGQNLHIEERWSADDMGRNGLLDVCGLVDGEYHWLQFERDRSGLE